MTKWAAETFTRRENTRKRGKRKAYNSVGKQHQGIDRKDLWRICESCREQTRMEVHNSQPAGSRRYKMMIM